MKTLILSLAAWLSYALIAQSQIQSLTVNDPDAWSSWNANITQADLIIKPKGLYLEYGLYLTFSADQSKLPNWADQLEIEMLFKLPSNSIVTDSWLWVEDSIMRALLINRDIASNIYNGIVNRRRDPSILYRNNRSDYELRVFPMDRDKQRKVKITYLVPVKWDNNKIEAPLPIDILKLSEKIPNLKLTVYSNNEYTDPYLTEFGYLPFAITNQPAYTVIPQYMISNSPKLTLAMNHNYQNGAYATHFQEKVDEGYYQFLIDIEKAFNIKNPTKNLFILECDPNFTSLSPQGILEELKTGLKRYLDETDSFNIMMASSSNTLISNKWIPAIDSVIDQQFNTLVIPSPVKKNNMEKAVRAAIGFIRNNGGKGEITGISNLRDYNNTSVVYWAFNRLEYLLNTSGIPVNFINYYNNSNSHYNTSNTALGNTSFFKKISDQTGGWNIQYDFYHIIDNWSEYYLITENVADLLDEGFIRLGGEIEDLSIQIRPLNGQASSGLEAGQPNFGYWKGNNSMIGRFTGTPPFYADLSYKLDNVIHTRTIYLSSFAMDSTIKNMWAGRFIYHHELFSDNDPVLQEMIQDTSKSMRSLSLYTAFLALEPSDTVRACLTCNDETSGGATGLERFSLNGYEISAFPNPFASEVQIKIDLGDQSISNDLIIEIYNISGRLVWVKELDKTADPHQFIWNGKDLSGNELPKGIYLLKIHTGKESITLKLVKGS